MLAIQQIVSVLAGLLFIINPQVEPQRDGSYIMPLTGEVLCFEDRQCGEPTADLNSDGSFIYQSTTGPFVVGCIQPEHGCKPVEVVEEVYNYWQFDSYTVIGDLVIAQHGDTVSVSTIEPIYGSTWTETEGAPCMITNHSTGETVTIYSGSDAWCDYDVEPGISYTITVTRHGEPVSMTFVADDVDQEYNPGE